MKNDSEMNKLKGLIDTCIKEFGYTDVKVIPSSSIIGSTQSLQQIKQMWKTKFIIVKILLYTIMQKQNTI